MKQIKGIILAGGSGSRLFPLTFCTSKQLMPVYDKPMIYYPISVLMRLGIKEILIITTPVDFDRFKNLLGNGSRIGLRISFKIQDKPNGIAESFIIGEDFIGKDDVCLILGDNIFYSEKKIEEIHNGFSNLNKNFSTIFGVKVNNSKDFGVIEFDKNNNPVKIVEKPKKTISNIAVSGLYFYKNNVIEIAKNLKPSKRNELEITDINNFYLKENTLKLEIFNESVSWIDTGTFDSLLKASNFFQELEKNTKLKYACIEEIALKMGFINSQQFFDIAKSMELSNYGKYLIKVYNDKNYSHRF